MAWRGVAWRGVVVRHSSCRTGRSCLPILAAPVTRPLSLQGRALTSPQRKTPVHLTSRPPHLYREICLAFRAHVLHFHLRYRYGQPNSPPCPALPFPALPCPALRCSTPSGPPRVQPLLSLLAAAIRHPPPGFAPLALPRPIPSPRALGLLITVGDGLAHLWSFPSCGVANKPPLSPTHSDVV